jgi:hypothetical protein
MKKIVMTTETKETVNMGPAGCFKTGVPVPVDDDALADSLLKRSFPKFEEYMGKEKKTSDK